MRPLLFLAHPVQTATIADMALLHEAEAIAWERGWVPVSSFRVLAGLELRDEAPADRAAVLGASMALLARCHAFALVGRRLTAGMREELEDWILMRRGAVYLARHVAAPNVGDQDRHVDPEGSTWFLRYSSRPVLPTIDERVALKIAAIVERMENVTRDGE